MAPESLEVFILTGEPRTDNGTSSLVFYGASKRGPVKITCEYQPYFFVESRATFSSDVAFKIAEERFTSLSNMAVRRLEFASIPEAERVRRYCRDAGFAVFESDVRARERFLMDRGINGGVTVQGEGVLKNGLLCFYNPTVSPAKVSVPFTICSLDIETSMSAPQVLSIAVHLSGAGKDERRVFMQGDGSEESFVSTGDERALLLAFQKWWMAADPDLLIGWNVIGFDLNYLEKRSEALGISLRLGRDARTFSISEKTGRFSRANVPGRVVLDGPQLLRSSFYIFESYSLENVAQKVLGEGKLIESDGNKGWEIERLFREDKSALAQYNLKDTVLVTRIFEKLGLIELTVRRTELSGMLLDQVGMSTASLDHFYLPRLHVEKFAAPDVGDIGDAGFGAGGYVMSPVAGIYDNILGLDFQSLYPTIIRTFNIDPLSRACAGLDAIVTPAGFKFSRTHSILPPFIGELMQERRAAKSTRNAPLSQAIKILMNSFYGVMGSSGSRLFHPDLPDAITSTGQWVLVQSKNWLESRGDKVIYGDTDSLFVAIGKNREVTDFAREGDALAGELTDWWRKRLREEFGVESQLILEFEKHYRKFLVPAARGSEGGAKKRYAGLVVQGGAESVEFVGLEVVRSDWTRLARDFQLELYTKIFRGEPIDDWVRNFVTQVKEGLFDDKLVYRKRLHKRVNEYGASPPPYARAAMLLRKPGREVRYVMTLKGPIPIELHPQQPDYSHYIDRQLRPVADSILEVFGRSFEEILSPQLRLF